MFHFLSIITWLEQHQFACLFKKLTHLDCPGCGIQRSIIELLKGNILESIKLYPPTIPILFLFALLGSYLIIKWNKGYLHLKYTYLFCAAIIVANYFYKIFLMLN
jgi:Protein of unknown function (DUF2752)